MKSMTGMDLRVPVDARATAGMRVEGGVEAAKGGRTERGKGRKRGQRGGSPSSSSYRLGRTAQAPLFLPFQSARTPPSTDEAKARLCPPSRLESEEKGLDRRDEVTYVVERGCTIIALCDLTASLSSEVLDTSSEVGRGWKMESRTSRGEEDGEALLQLKRLPGLTSYLAEPLSTLIGVSE